MFIYYKKIRSKNCFTVRVLEHAVYALQLATLDWQLHLVDYFCNKDFISIIKVCVVVVIIVFF